MWLGLGGLIITVSLTVGPLANWTDEWFKKGDLQTP